MKYCGLYVPQNDGAPSQYKVKKGIEHWNKVCIKQHEVTNPGLWHKTTRTVLAACYALTLIVLCNWKRGSPRLLTEVLWHGDWPISCTQLTATIQEWQMTTKHGQWLDQSWASSLWMNSASPGTPTHSVMMPSLPDPKGYIMVFTWITSSGIQRWRHHQGG